MVASGGTHVFGSRKAISLSEASMPVSSEGFRIPEVKTTDQGLSTEDNLLMPRV
jgi:hypothetical protein